VLTLESGWGAKVREESEKWERGEGVEGKVKGRREEGKI